MRDKQIVNILKENDLSDVEVLRSEEELLFVNFYYDFDKDILDAAKAYANEESKIEYNENGVIKAINNKETAPKSVKKRVIKDMDSAMKSVYLDSNMAFGTGEHETTAMCIELLQDFISKDKSVIDVGCGSGILGITAIKLGAKDVLMTDIDEYAVEATNHNSKINGVTAKVLLKNLLDDENTKGDIILANIMAETLVYFSNYIGQNLYENGVIILSGILLTKKDMVISAYENNGFKLVKCLEKGEWCALAMRK